MAQLMQLWNKGRALLFLLWGLVRLAYDVVLGLLGVPVRASNAALHQKLLTAATYNEWKAAARVLDEEEGFQQWKEEEDSKYYNFEGVRSRIQQLSLHKRSANLDQLLAVLRTDVHRATLGVTNPGLYRYRSGTKSAVRTYVNLMAYLIKNLAGEERIPVDKRRRVLAEIAEVYGRSALLLNGSVALGTYHLGVVKGLRDVGLLPRVIFGANTGALVAASICCNREIDAVVEGTATNFSAFAKRGASGSFRRKWKRLRERGTLMDVTVLLQFAKDNIGELTFLEAYRKTGRILSIHVGRYLGKTHGRNSLLLNYLTTPHVLVYTAAVASCATVYLYDEAQLLAKTTCGEIVPFDPPAYGFTPHSAHDGFHINDAVQRLRELFNVKVFIVSECSVSRLPFISLSHRTSLLPRLTNFFTEEFWRQLALLARTFWPRTRLTSVLQTIHKPIMGDIVVYPASSWADLLKILRNPDKTFVDYCISRGQLQLWPRIEQIRSHLAVELAVYDALDEIDELHSA
jgi:predicted acylesterase/phospholipase RssA